MKDMMCNFCGHRTTATDDDILVICRFCQEQMEEEDRGDGDS